MTERFNTNNAELNKKKFMEQNLNIYKAKLSKNKKGAKFVK